jgi:hypothetical protein
MIDDRDALLEAAATAFRERAASGRILPSPAWADLAPGDRAALFELQLATRAVERALDPQGFSATAQLVLGRARGLEQVRE